MLESFGSLDNVTNHPLAPRRLTTLCPITKPDVRRRSTTRCCARVPTRRSSLGEENAPSLPSVVSFRTEMRVNITTSDVPSARKHRRTATEHKKRPYESLGSAVRDLGFILMTGLSLNSAVMLDSGPAFNSPTDGFNPRTSGLVSFG